MIQVVTISISVSIWIPQSLLGISDAHFGRFELLHFSGIKDELLLVSAGDDGTIRVWDLKPRKELHVLQGHQGRVVDVKFIGKQAEAIASG